MGRASQNSSAIPASGERTRPRVWRPASRRAYPEGLALRALFGYGFGGDAKPARGDARAPRSHRENPLQMAGCILRWLPGIPHRRQRLAHVPMYSSSQPELKIFSGSAHRELASRIAEYVGLSLGEAEVKAFADGETSVRINENIRGRDVYIVQPTCPPVNHNLMELLVLVDAARRASAARITAVMPFFGYARQDRKGPSARADHGKARRQLDHGRRSGPGADRRFARTADSRLFRHSRGSFVRFAGVFKAPAPARSRAVAVVSPDVGGIKVADSYAQALGVHTRDRRQEAQERHGSRFVLPDR